MKFPIQNIDIKLYQEQVRTLLNDGECAIFMDTNILSQLYRLNDKARKDFYDWISSCGDRFHIPAWVIHEYSDKIFSGNIKEYLSELSRIKTLTKEFNNIADFVKGYIGDSLLIGSAYQDKTDQLKIDIDQMASTLNKISKAINTNLEKHQSTVHEEIVRQLESKILTSDIFSIVNNSETIFSQRSRNRIPPGYKDCNKEENSAGDYIIWTEILDFCKKKNVKKAILITRDRKADIVYEPNVQTEAGVPVKSAEKRIKVAKPCLRHEFYIQTQSDEFYVIDFKFFVKIFASQYKDLALSFQLAIAEEEKESAKEEKESEKIVEPEFAFTKAAPNECIKKVDSPKSSCDEPLITTQETGQYLGTAMADKQYQDEDGKGCVDELIAELKTHNWYEQNPAIDQVMRYHNSEWLDNIENRSSVFVLGRNIVQSAEGASGNAIMYVENFDLYIKEWDVVFQKALIDGMLFEVFFDSYGNIRKNEFKAHFFEDIINNIQKLSLENPYEFINSRLSKVETRFVPSVGNDMQYTFVFTIDADGNTTNLKCNGTDISNTFKHPWILQFAEKENVSSELSYYYGILRNNINIEGIRDDLKEVRYIQEENYLPF